MWKPSPSSSPPSWNCTALRAPWSCLRAATVRLRALGARADAPRAPRAPSLRSLGAPRGLTGCWRVFLFSPGYVPGSPGARPLAIPAACFCPLNKPTGWAFPAGLRRPGRHEPQIRLLESHGLCRRSVGCEGERQHGLVWTDPPHSPPARASEVGRAPGSPQHWAGLGGGLPAPVL